MVVQCLLFWLCYYDLHYIRVPALADNKGVYFKTEETFKIIKLRSVRIDYQRK
jgi:hypothetical protein